VPTLRPFKPLQIYTANCGYLCSTAVYKNGQWYGYVKEQSSADRCCYNHDIRLKVAGISGASKASCWIHREFYNCMVSRRSSWGQSIVANLLKCVGC